MIDNYMMYHNLPTIDLHGKDRFESSMLVKEFINDNSKMHNKLLKVIHGKGTFVLKEVIHKELKMNKKVLTYKVDLFNNGVTIVELV
jgi:DNA-nicking Smr family endonuclease